MRPNFIPSSFQQLKPGASHEYIPLSETATPHSSIISVKRLRQHRWLDGYHFGVFCCALTAGTVLLINVIFTVVVVAKHGISGGIGILQDGDCNETKRLDLWLHLLINVLSTLLLGASNYSMQCLCAPTRQDLDEAHRQNVWMDIGVPSVRNIYRISWTRKLLWCLLFMSSVPVHLMYNSVLFSSTSISEWTAFAVTSDFLTGAPYYVSSFNLDIDAGEANPRLERLLNSTSLVRLENEECLDTYDPVIVSAWGDVLLVSTQPSSNDSLIWAMPQDVEAGSSGKASFCYFEPILSNTDCLSNGSPDPNDWPLREGNGSDYGSSGKVSHCLAEKVQEHCKMRFNMPLMAAVIACNIVKVTCMGIIVWKLDPRPLVTIGDAIASFLDTPDATTAENCLSSKKGFKKGSSWISLPAKYRRRRHKWFASASYTRWLTTTILCSLTLAAAVGLLALATVSVGSPFSLGFGAINVSATIESLQGNIFTSILIANSPQLLLSFLYFAYNGLWTCMLLAQEWSEYANKRKPLRVTSPSSGQRSTYRLQLPYRYGIPLLIVSGTLHWLVSQSIFLVILDAYNSDGTPDLDSNDSLSRCGYSPIAILVTIITGSIVLIVGIAKGFRRYPMNGIPLAGSCSAAISAACHPPAGDDRASKKAVMWGACGSEVDGDWNRVMDVGNAALHVGKEGLRQQDAGGGEVKVGHCSFTSFNVEAPIEGNFYAGLKHRRA